MLAGLAGAIKTSFIPGSLGFLLAGVVAGVVLLYIRPIERWGRRWLLVLSLGYLALSLPVVARWLERGTRPTSYPAIDSAAKAGGATAIVLLGNGLATYELGDIKIEALPRRTAFNIMEGVRLYRLLHPALVVTSGGRPNPLVQPRSEAEAMRDALVALGVPAARIAMETESVNTHEQARRLKPILAKHPRFLLVTSPIHMGRALTFFETHGMRPIPAPSPLDYMPGPATVASQFTPSTGALRASEMSIYEYLGVAYGWTQGWLAARDAPQ